MKIDSERTDGSDSDQLPIIGTVSDVAGTFSATININTEKATKHVSPSVTFSPEDVGSLELEED